MASDPALFTPGATRPGQVSQTNSYFGIRSALANPSSPQRISSYTQRLFGLSRSDNDANQATSSHASGVPREFKLNKSNSRDGEGSSEDTKQHEADHDEHRDESISPSPTISGDSREHDETPDDKNADKKQSSKERSDEKSEPRGSHEDVEAGKQEKDNDDDDKEEKKDPNLVDWDGEHDKGNPMNWPLWKKCMATASLSLTTLTITFASSIFSSATEATSEEFGASQEMMTLGLSLFVLGFAFGPLCWGPLSELYGRKKPLLFGFFCFALFQIPVAVATNLQTIFLCRYFGGLFGSSALAIIGGALADFWDPVDRGVAICFFAGATFLGPVLGPIIGSYVTESYLGWRWTAWVTLIMAGLFGGISLLAVPESYAPVLLQQRAKKLRFETKNWALHAEADEQQTDLKDIVETYLARPFIMIVREPILVLITVYMALIYGILYLFFEAYPIAFQEVRGYTPGLASLPFISILIGVVLGSSIIVFMTRTRYKRKLEAAGGKPVPEERLPPMIIGGIFFPIGLFWFAWTSNPDIIWVPQVLAGIPIGAGVLMIFMQGLNYLIDVYLMHANSALAANTLLRSLAGAGFPMFATPMFHKLGVDWATTLLGCLAVVCFPFPIVFYMYGEKIRKLSKFSPTD